jgi:hypothetical protein
MIPLNRRYGMATGLLELETSLEQLFPFESFKLFLNSHFDYLCINAFRTLASLLFSNGVRVGRMPSIQRRFHFHDKTKCPVDLPHVTTPSCTRKSLHIVPFPSYSLSSLSSLYSTTGAE